MPEKFLKTRVGVHTSRNFGVAVHFRGDRKVHGTNRNSYLHS